MKNNIDNNDNSVEFTFKQRCDDCVWYSQCGRESEDGDLSCDDYDPCVDYVGGSYIDGGCVVYDYIAGLIERGRVEYYIEFEEYMNEWDC